MTYTGIARSAQIRISHTEVAKWNRAVRTAVL